MDLKDDKPPSLDDNDDSIWSGTTKERSLSDSSIRSLKWTDKDTSTNIAAPLRQRSHSTNKEMWLPTKLVKGKPNELPTAPGSDFKESSTPEPVKPPRPKRLNSFKRKDKAKKTDNVGKQDISIDSSDPVKPPRRKLPNPPPVEKPANLGLKSKETRPKENRDIVSKPVVTASPYQDNITVEDVKSGSGRRIISVYDDAAQSGMRKVESFYDFLYSGDVDGARGKGSKRDLEDDDNFYDDVPLDSSRQSLASLGNSRRIDSDSLIYDEVIVNKEYYLMPVDQNDAVSEDDPWGSDFEEDEIFDNVDYGDDDDDFDIDDDDGSGSGSGNGTAVDGLADITPMMQRRRPFKLLADTPRTSGNSPYKKVAMPSALQVKHGLKGIPGHLRGCFGMSKAGSLPYLSRQSKGESKLIESEEEPEYVDPNIADTENYTQPVMPDMTPGLSHEQTKRYQIVKFILESETDYMKLMDMLIKRYELPVRERDLLEPSKIDIIFAPVHKVLDCHVMFNIALSARMAEWSPDEKIGDILYALFSKSMVLEAYSTYVNNFAKAMDNIKSACRTHLAFAQLLKARRQSHRERVTLHSLMLRPVIRFAQLVDLLQELLVVTPVSHPDRIPLQMALTQLESLADNLKERKRESELRSRVKQLDTATAHLSKPLSSGNRYFIRQDDFVQCVIEGDTIVHTKRRRLIMLSDMLLCVSLIKGKRDRMANLITDTRTKYKLKWNVPLTDVEVIEYGPGVQIYASGNRTTITQAKEGQYRQYSGCQEHFEDLQHDMTVIGQIAGLVATLRRSYQVLDNDKVQKWHKAVQRTIEEESRLANIYWLELSLPSKTGRVNYIFSTENPGVKADWLTALNTAMLRLSPDNNPGWYLPEDDGTGGVAVQRRNMPLLKDNSELFLLNPKARVTGVVSCPDVSDPLPGMQDNYNNLWLLCGGGESTGLVSVVRVSSASSPQIIESFLVCDSHILCGEYVRRTCPDEGKVKGPLSGKFGFPFPTVWLGTQSGKIYIYNGVDAERRYVMSVKLPDAVLAIRQAKGKIFAGLADGSVVVFKPNDDGVWDFSQPKAIGLSKSSIMSIATTANSLWCASANKIHVIDLEHETVKHVIEVDPSPKTTVRHLVCYGIGVWVSLWKLPTIKLFHGETMEHVQDMNIAYTVNTMQRDVDSQLEQAKLDKLYVSCMTADEGLLWVGTSVGVILIFPLPRLEGIPLVSGRAYVSFHTYQSRVRALYPLRNNPDAGVEIGRARGKRPGYQLFREHEMRDACVQTDVGVSGTCSYVENGPETSKREAKSTAPSASQAAKDFDEDIDAICSDDEFSFVDDDHKVCKRSEKNSADFKVKIDAAHRSGEVTSTGVSVNPPKLSPVSEVGTLDFARMMEEFQGFGTSAPVPSLPDPPEIPALLVTGSISKDLDRKTSGLPNTTPDNAERENVKNKITSQNGSDNAQNGTSDHTHRGNEQHEMATQSKNEILDCANDRKAGEGDNQPSDVSQNTENARNRTPNVALTPEVAGGDVSTSADGQEFRGRAQSSGQYVELSEAQEQAREAGEAIDARNRTINTGGGASASSGSGQQSTAVSPPQYITVLDSSQSRFSIPGSDSENEATIPENNESYSVFSADSRQEGKKLENLKSKLPYPVLLVSAGEGHLDLRRKRQQEKNTEPRLMIWQIN